MVMFVQVAVNVPGVTEILDYHLPPELEGRVNAGCLVVVPLGKQNVQGIVLRQTMESQVQQTRPVAALLDALPVLTLAQLALAAWMAEESLAPLSSCLMMMLPPGLAQQADTLYSLRQCGKDPAIILNPLQQRILKLVQARGELRGRQIEAALPRQNWKPAIQALVRNGWLQGQPVLPPPVVRPRMVRTARLAVSPEQAEAQFRSLGRGAALARRQAMLRFLMEQAEPVSVTWVYAASGGNLQDLYRLSDLGLVILGEDESWRDPLAERNWIPHEAPPLTPDQQTVLQALFSGIHAVAGGQPVKPYLLHGVTGSGKTEVYLQAVAEILRLGRQALILVPEISLTPQTVQRFAARFPGQVGVVHSRLSSGERYDTWRRARAGILPVIIGARSALFTPLPQPGVIILDEFSDDSFYQGDILPHYHAARAATAYARMTGAALLMGSATPDINTFYRAEREKWHILRLPARILAHRDAVQVQLSQIGRSQVKPSSGVTTSLPLPPVRVIDMRVELKAGNTTIFSRALQQALGQTLENGQQAILYLNRRGSATYIFCRDCGHNLRCPRCDLPLTLHTDQNALLCHQCGYRRLPPKKCPACGSQKIRQFGTGTEKVEREAQALFPEARLLRWDAETTRQKGAHEIILAHFIERRADILIGTQMLAKGLDLPLVTLVGVVLADVGLNLPDYRAAERVFHLLTQVAGRAGRSPLGGQAIFQTFQPDHYVIRAAANHDFNGFYQKELAYRRELGYPPFTRLVRLEYRHLKDDEARLAAERLNVQLQRWIEEGDHNMTVIIGPAPCFFGRLESFYRWQIILRGPNPAAILRGRKLEEGWRIEVDPPVLL